MEWVSFGVGGLIFGHIYGTRIELLQSSWYGQLGFSVFIAGSITGLDCPAHPFINLLVNFLPFTLIEEFTRL